MQITTRVLTALVVALTLLASGTARASDFDALLMKAKEGEIGAMHDVGAAYANGGVVARDYSEAMRWFERAALKGQHNSMYSLAIMHRMGQGVAVDLVKAYVWYALAAKHIPKTEDEWFIPRAKIAMYERRPREIAAQLSQEDLLHAERLREEIGKRIEIASHAEPKR